MILLGQRLQGFYPMLEESFQDGGIHRGPVEPFAGTGVEKTAQAISERLRVCETGLDKTGPTFEQDAFHTVKRLGTGVIETTTKPVRINHGRWVEEGVALVDRDEVELTGIRGAVCEEYITGHLDKFHPATFWQNRDRSWGEVTRKCECAILYVE